MNEACGAGARAGFLVLAGVIIMSNVLLLVMTVM